MGGQKNSYSAQINYYSEKFENSDTEILVDIYADEGISGTSEDKTSEQLDMLIDIFENRSEIFTEFNEDIFSQIVEKITVKDNTLKFELMYDLKFKEKVGVDIKT